MHLKDTPEWKELNDRIERLELDHGAPHLQGLHHDGILLARLNSHTIQIDELRQRILDERLAILGRRFTDSQTEPPAAIPPSVYEVLSIGLYLYIERLEKLDTPNLKRLAFEAYEWLKRYAPKGDANG